MSTVRLLTGDVRTVLRALPTAYFDCVVTSPPYWGLRSYLPDGDPMKKFEIGLEPTLGEHLAVMVHVFREVRRVLKKHGTLWLNYGDCYAAAPNGKSAAEYKADGSDDRTFRDKPFSTVGPIYDPNHGAGRGRFTGTDLGHGGAGTRRIDHGGRVVAGGLLKAKDLCMVPNRLAIALQDDGWWVRSEIIWHKPNPMPESVYDRPTSAHEKIWLLTKSEDYFYNHEAIREAVTGTARARKPGPGSRQNQDRIQQTRKVKVPGGWDVAPRAHGTINRAGRTEATYVERAPGVSPKAAEPRKGIRHNTSYSAATGDIVSDTRNARNVWTIAPKAFRGAHYATFPPALAERCIKAGVPPTTCHLCGEAKTPEQCGGICVGQERAPGRVLDPFGGAGTVGLVAAGLGLDCTLIEIKPSDVEMAAARIRAGVPSAVVVVDCASRASPLPPEPAHANEVIL